MSRVAFATKLVDFYWRNSTGYAILGQIGFINNGIFREELIN